MNDEVVRCQFVHSVQHASYYGPKAKLSQCREPAKKQVEVDGTRLLLCAAHAEDVAQRRFVRLGA